MRRGISRRALLRWTILGVGATALGACTPAAPTNTPAPAKPTEPAKAAEAPKPTEAPKPAAATTKPAEAAKPTEAPKAAEATKPAAAPAPAKPATSPKAVNLRYWQYNVEVEDVERKLVDAYAKKTPGTQIKYEAIPWQQYWEKVNATLAGGDAPDVWNTGPTFYYEYVKRNQLVNLTDYVKRDIDPGAVFPKAARGWEVPKASGGPSYGVTRNWVIGVLYYNIDLFEKEKVAPPTNDWTFDDLLNTAAKLSKPTDSPQTAQWGYNISVAHDFYNQMVYANGGKVLDVPGGTRCVLDQHPQAVEACQYLVDMVHKQKVSPAPGFFEGLGNPFQTGKVAMLTTGSWGIGSFRKITAFKWELAMFPKGKASRSIYGGPDGLVLSQNAKDHDGSWELTRWLVGEEPGIELYNAWGGIPVLKKLANDERFLNARPGDIRVALESEQYMHPGDFNAGYNEWHVALRNELTAAVLKKKTSEEAIKDATKAIQDIIDKNK